MSAAQQKAKGLKNAYVDGIVEGAREAVGGSPLGGYGGLSGQEFPSNGSGLGVAEKVIGRDPYGMEAAGNPGLGARGALGAQAFNPNAGDVMGGARYDLGARPELGAQAFNPSAPDVMGAARYDLSARPALGKQDFNPNSPDVMGASRYNLGARAALDSQAFDPNAPNLGVSATQGLGPVSDGAEYAKGIARAKVKGGIKAAAAADYRGAAGNPSLEARGALGAQGFDPNVARML